MKNKREDRFEAIVDQFVKNDLIAQEEYSYYLYGVKHLEVLYYIDFETMEGIPICNKPNCRHISWKEDRNTKCDAANIDISTVFPYEGKLYGFRSLSDGGSELVVSDLDGGDWKSKGMFITAEEIFQGGVVVGNQMFF